MSERHGTGAAGNDGDGQTTSPHILHCVECNAISGTEAWHWRGYRIDDPSENEDPALAFYCPVCAEREFGGLHSEHGRFYS